MSINHKFSFTILMITLILLVITIGPTYAWSLTPPIDPLNQSFAVAASGGNPLSFPFVIAIETVDTMDPAVVYNSQNQEYLVVWWNDRPGCDDIFDRRVSKNGTPLGWQFAIANGCSAERRYPGVAYNSQANE